MHHYTTDIQRFAVNIVLTCVVKSPENTFFMTNSHSKVSTVFSVVLQLNVQD